jgi:hypothetical protein
MQFKSKMISLFLCCCFYFFTNAVLGQSLKDRNYYAHINKAELYVIDSNYSKAIVCYDSAFKEKEFPFAKDRYNAAVCAALLKKNEKCYLELKFVIDKGFGVDNLQTKEVFRTFFKTVYGNRLISYSQTTPKIYLPRYRKKLDSLFYTDQFFRKKEGKYAVYLDTIKKIDQSNVNILNALLLQFGFPSEELIGVPDDSFIPITYRSVIIHQQNGSLSRVFDYTSVLKKALEEGNIETHIAAELISKSSGYDTYGIFGCGLTKYVLDSINSVAGVKTNPIANYDSIKWGYVMLPKGYEDEININRSKIGLETIGELRTKSVFLLKDKRFDFALPSSLSTFIYDNKPEYEDAIKNLIPIK